MQRVAEPFPDLVDESLDEATFLWRRWETELTSLTRNLDEVWSWTEDRLHGALDGVRAGGAGAIDLATAGLRSGEIDRITVSAAVLGSSPDPRATDAIVTALGAAEEAQLAAVVRGLEVLGADRTLRAAAAVLAAGGPASLGALCRLKRFRRSPSGEEMLAAFHSNIPSVQADAVRAALCVPSGHAEEMIVTALGHDDPVVRYAAVETGLSRGTEGAWDTAIRAAQRLDGDAGRYLKWLAMLGTAEDHDVVYAALRVPDLRPDAIWALGHIGTVRAAEACLAGMQHDELARACGEAYCWITGADLERDRLVRKETPPETPAFEDDDLDANLVPPPDALWPLPDHEAARRDWSARRPGFAADIRHIHGLPVAGDTWLARIETGPMLRRPDLVFELRARMRGVYDVEPRAFARRQRRMMAAGRAAVSSHRGH